VWQWRGSTVVADDAALACVATNRDVSESPPSLFQDCRDVVHLSLFFDGTGNNWERDSATKSSSNVGRMFDAAIRKKRKSIYPIYIAGVGTPYNEKAAS